MKQYKIVISDCHLSAGKVYEGRLNPHEDFYFDDEMCEMIEHFSSGKFGETAEGPVPVELFVNGDFFDFLNVPIDGEFEDVIDEEMAVRKLQAIFEGHPKVMSAFRKFAGKPQKKITYLIGNHDADLFFPKVRELITQHWDPQGQFPSSKVDVIADRDRVRFPGGVEVHHGNQFEAVHVLNFEKPLLKSFLNKPVLNLPWGSFFVLKIINRLKPEREFIDKVRPIKGYLFYGMLFDTLFTLRFAFLGVYYFLKTRFIYSPRRRSSMKVTAQILGQERTFLKDLEREAREILDRSSEVTTVIFGHTHQPMDKVYADGKQYINTGTWTKMINLDLRTIGQRYCLTFAFVEIEGSQSQCELRQWMGITGPHKRFQG